MSDNISAVQGKPSQENMLFDETELSLDDLENQLNAELAAKFSDLELLEEDLEKISNPDSIGDTILSVVWEQFINQVGAVAGQDFIEENRGLTLDLRKEAHIQTTENFADGKIATHNAKIDYQKRYDDWQSNFVKDKNGKVVTHETRTGKQEATLVKGARQPFDKGRPSGSVENHTDMDHTVSAAEIIRDSAANAHMTKEEQIAFANSDANLNEIDASLNRSKGDKSMDDWLDTPNANGQKPDEIFTLTEEDKEKLRQKDKEAREEYEKQKQEAEKRSVEAGKQSRKEEAFRIGGKALRAVLMGLLTELLKNIVQKLIAWIRAGEKNFKAFIEQIKDALFTFAINFKQNVLTAGDTLLITIATAVAGPVVAIVKKVWQLIKQGEETVKDAINFFRDSANKEKSFSMKMLRVGEIAIGGLTATAAIVSGELFEKTLMSIPVFTIEIPLLGSLANIMGIFLGAVVSGIIGALILRLIDKAIAKKQKEENLDRQIEKKNEILATQEQLTTVKIEKLAQTKEQAATSIAFRHGQALEAINEALTTIYRDDKDHNEDQLESIDKSLDLLLQ